MTVMLHSSSAGEKEGLPSAGWTTISGMEREEGPAAYDLWTSSGLGRRGAGRCISTCTLASSMAFMTSATVNGSCYNHSHKNVESMDERMLTLTSSLFHPTTAFFMRTCTGSLGRSEGRTASTGQGS